jgi:hypothetical protein
MCIPQANLMYMYFHTVIYYLVETKESGKHITWNLPSDSTLRVGRLPGGGGVSGLSGLQMTGYFKILYFIHLHTEFK